MSRIHVTPIPETRRVIRPDTRRALPPSGADVAGESYWRRRKAAGEVTISKAGGAAGGKKKAKS